MKLNSEGIDIKKVTEACKKFRSGIEKCDKDSLDISLQAFPRGSCGSVCSLLGGYLDEVGLGVWNYVCGEDVNGTHAWLEKDGVIVDITSDQFDEGVAVFVGNASCFYEKYEIRDCHPYGDSLDGETILEDRLKDDYSSIVKEVDKQLKMIE